MKRLLILWVVVLVLVAAITGCSIRRIHTQTVDRVDQELGKGNRGYIMGTPPPAPELGERKREFLAIDINLEWPRIEIKKKDKVVEKRGKAVEKLVEAGPPVPAPIEEGPEEIPLKEVEIVEVQKVEKEIDVVEGVEEIK